MPGQALPNIVQTYLLFIVLPVVLGFTFNVVALYVILNADLIWQRIAGARRAHQSRQSTPDPPHGRAPTAAD